MMNRSSVTSYALSLAALLASMAPATAAPPELKTQGNLVVVKATGVPVRLAGVNVPSLEWGTGENLTNALERAMTEWKANVIRLPVDQGRWNAGGSYVTTVDNFIAQASAANVYVILDLHEYAYPTSASVTFWNNAANRYKNNSAVLFGLLNEPHGTGWEIWRNGDGANPGMQALLDTVRATGALNIVLAGGGGWGYDLSGVLNGYALTDTASGNGIIYDSHVYPWKSNIQASVANIAQVYPVLLGELGHPGGTSYNGMSFDHHSVWVPKIMDWVNSHNLHWTGWSFHPGASPCLVYDFDYSPTPYWGTTALANLQAYQNPSSQRVIGGTVIGSTGTRTNPTSGVLTDVNSGAVVAFNDGHQGYFDGPSANGSWTGLDLVTPRRITRVDYMPRTNNGALMVGGVFQGSNSATFSSGVVTLFTVTTAPVHTGGIYTSANVSNTGTYRYVRYLGPNGSYCNVASLLFYTGDGVGSGAGSTDEIVDNGQGSGVVITGSWLSSTTAGYYGTNALHDNSTGKGSKSVRFTPHLSVAGNYEVFARWSSHSNRAPSVPIDISHGGGTEFVSVNQQSGGGAWVSLGVFPFSAGTAGNVLVANKDTVGFVVADAVRFVRSAEVILDNDDPGVTLTGSWSKTTTAGFYGTDSIHDSNAGKGSKSVRFTPPIVESRNYEVYLWWTSAGNREEHVPVDIISAGGTTTVTVNEKVNGGQWISLGTYPFVVGTTGSVLIRTTGTDEHVIADAARFVPR